MLQPSLSPLMIPDPDPTTPALAVESEEVGEKGQEFGSWFSPGTRKLTVIHLSSQALQKECARENHDWPIPRGQPAHILRNPHSDEHSRVWGSAPRIPEFIPEAHQLPPFLGIYVHISLSPLEIKQ